MERKEEQKNVWKKSEASSNKTTKKIILEMNNVNI